MPVTRGIEGSASSTRFKATNSLDGLNYACASCGRGFRHRAGFFVCDCGEIVDIEKMKRDFRSSLDTKQGVQSVLF